MKQSSKGIPNKIPLGQDEAMIDLCANICKACYNDFYDSLEEWWRIDAAIKYLCNKQKRLEHTMRGCYGFILERWDLFTMYKIDHRVPVEQLMKAKEKFKDKYVKKVKKVSIEFKESKNGK